MSSIDSLGFHSIVIAGPERDDYLTPFIERMQEAAKGRGISLDEPSAALDASRDVIIDHAAQGAEWDIMGNVLYVAYPGASLDIVREEESWSLR